MAQLKRIAGANQPPATLDRREAVPALIERPTEWLVVAGLALIVATSAVGSWVHVQGALERAYERDLDQARVRSIARSRAVAELARDLSRQLHGSVQSTLVACAAMSEQAVVQGDSAQLRATLMEAHRVLSAAVGPGGAEARSSSACAILASARPSTSTIPSGVDTSGRRARSRGSRSRSR